MLVNQRFACLSRGQIAARQNVMSLLDNGLGFHGRMFEMGSGNLKYDLYVLQFLISTVVQRKGRISLHPPSSHILRSNANDSWN